MPRPHARCTAGLHARCINLAGNADVNGRQTATLARRRDDAATAAADMRAFVRSFGSEAVRERTRDVAGIVTVTCALLVYGVLQERIMTVGFGPNKSELFEHSIFLVLCNRLCTCVLAFAYIAASEPSIVPAAPWHSYASVSCSNVIATYMQYEALKYVSFAIQTLAKSAKALPVMVWGSLYTGKRYKTSDYLHASIITLGCTVFIVSGEGVGLTAGLTG